MEPLPRPRVVQQLFKHGIRLIPSKAQGISGIFDRAQSVAQGSGGDEGFFDLGLNTGRLLLGHGQRFIFSLTNRCGTECCDGVSDNRRSKQ